MTFRTLYRADLPASQSPFRVVDEEGRELKWANRFLDMQCVRGLARLSLRAYTYNILHFVRWWSRQAGVDALDFRAEQFTESTLIDSVRAQVDEIPKPTPENINSRSYMLRRLFRFNFHQDMPHAPYLMQRNWYRPPGARQADSCRRSEDKSAAAGNRAVEPGTGAPLLAQFP
jgi:hypothetical protein